MNEKTFNRKNVKVDLILEKKFVIRKAFEGL